MSFIPEWNEDGFLPAFDPAAPTSRERSPYSISLIDLIMGFGDSEARRGLLLGLLNFRSELHQVGFVDGFQWINGSFTEDIEARENRSPNDIDVVTFLRIPEWCTEEYLDLVYQGRFERSMLKNKHHIDSFFVQLNQTTSQEIVNESTYWYSLWSHTRNGEWKGYLQIDLGGADDEEARLQLDQLSGEGGGQG